MNVVPTSSHESFIAIRADFAQAKTFIWSHDLSFHACARFFSGSGKEDDVVEIRIDDVAPNGYTLDRTTIRQDHAAECFWPIRSG